ERLLRSLKGRDRATMQGPLNAFTGLARTFLDRHRATLAQHDGENDLARSIEAQARAQFEEEMKTWRQNNQPLVQAIRDGDEDAVRTPSAADTSANAGPAPQTPTPAAAPVEERADEPAQDTGTSESPGAQEHWILGEDRPAPYATDNQHDTAAIARETLHALFGQWQEDFGQQLPAEPGEELAAAIAEFTDSWEHAQQTPAADWGLQLQAYTRIRLAAAELAARPDLQLSERQATGRLRHLARAAALHVDRLAHTPPPMPDETWLREMARRFEAPYASAAEAEHALDTLAEAAAQHTTPNGFERTEAQVALRRAQVAAARTPGGAAAHLHALHGLARAIGVVDLDTATGSLPTHLGRLARTLLTDPDLADTLLPPAPRPLAVAARDLEPAPPYAHTDGRFDNEGLERSHAAIVSAANLARQQSRPKQSATERRLARLLEEIERRPLMAPADDWIDPAWPHLLDEAAQLADQVHQEHEDEGYRAYRENDFRDFAAAATRHARFLNATLIETGGHLDAELEALTEQALADPALLATMGTPGHPLTSNRPVPYAPALLDWLSARAEAMSPLLRHTLHADFTPRGFTGAFARLANTVRRNATGTEPPRTGGRLPVPPQWQQHAVLIDQLLDAASTDPRTVGVTVSNEPLDRQVVNVVRDWIQDQVMEQLGTSSGMRDDALVDAFFVDDAALDLLATHITAHTAQHARIALRPQDDTLYAVQRGREMIVCRGAELHERLGADAGLRISWHGEDPWTLWSREGGRIGTLQPMPAQDDAARFLSIAKGLTLSDTRALLSNHAKEWPGLLGDDIDTDLFRALIEYAATPRPDADPLNAYLEDLATPQPGAAVQEPDTALLVRAEQAGDWALEVLHPTPFPSGPEAVQAAEQLLSNAGQWLAEHRALIEDVTPWHAQATEDALADAAASLPEPGGSGGPAEHWRAMSEVHQHLLLLRAELTDKGEARPLHPALTQLTILLRHSDNYLDRAAARGMPEHASLRRTAGKNAYTTAEQAVAALAGLQAAWREWAEEVGPIDQLPSAERHSVIALAALLDEPRPGATPAGWVDLLDQVIDISRLRAEEVSDRMLGWQALDTVATDMWRQWTATVVHEPDLAAAAARQSGALQLTRPHLDPASPPTSHEDFAARHNYLVRLAQRATES
ncbi:hypothetical protein, partial [Streptomyces tropicalis]